MILVQVNLVKQLLVDWKPSVLCGSNNPSTMQIVSHVIVSRWLVQPSSDALVDVYLWGRANLLCREYTK